MLIRASQINGCAVCLDMHTKDAAHAGETSVRLNLVAAWRDAKVFTDAERAALELAEQGTRIADGPAESPTRPGRTRPSTTTPNSSPGWWPPIAVINAYNRLNVISRNEGGDYQPGQWG